MEKDKGAAGRRGSGVQAFLTEARGDAARLRRGADEGAQDPCMIAGVGGDGTVNEVLDGLHLSRTGNAWLYPGGRGQRPGRGLKLPRQPRPLSAKGAGAKYPTGCLDYGDRLLRGRTSGASPAFVVSCGIGLDAAVCHESLYTSPAAGLSA